MAIQVSLSGLWLGTVLLTSMMLKNSASCSIGSLPSSWSMCDKMVAGKKYLVWVGVCVCVCVVCVWVCVCVCACRRGVQTVYNYRNNCAESTGLILILQDWEWDKFLIPPVVQ